jgi:thiol peroxidase
MQTKRFNDEAAKLTGIDVYTISMDLPFAQNRWCTAMAVDHVKMLSDHRTATFGANYGTLIKEWRIESRAIFVVGKDDTLKHVEYVKEVAEHPNYDAALAAAKAAI